MPVTQTLDLNAPFLSTLPSSTTPTLYITAETDSAAEFDQATLRAWRDEGFAVTYIPYGDGGRRYRETLGGLERRLGIGEKFGVVAFGDAAATALDVFRRPAAAGNRLCALVAYYPSEIPHETFPMGVRVLLHLAGDSVGVARNPEVLGLQGKRRTVSKKIPAGTGTGGSLRMGYPSYTYQGVEPGFAEKDLEEYDRIAAGLAWSRSLACVRKAFGADVDLEAVWEDHIELEFKKKDAARTMETMVAHPYVNHVPTLTGGIGHKELLRFYDEFFIPGNPPSLDIKLLSRTIGADRVVDEMFVSFKHTNEMPWMLPGVPPTGKKVEVALVSVVCIKGGRLYHEHIYWDQASVLVQLGLLDPKLVPEAFKKKGVERLPVVGAESARKVLDKDSEPSNELIEDW